MHYLRYIGKRVSRTQKHNAERQSHGMVQSGPIPTLHRHWISHRPDTRDTDAERKHLEVEHGVIDAWCEGNVVLNG